MSTRVRLTLSRPSSLLCCDEGDDVGRRDVDRVLWTEASEAVLFADLLMRILDRVPTPNAW